MRRTSAFVFVQKHFFAISSYRFKSTIPPPRSSPVRRPIVSIHSSAISSRFSFSRRISSVLCSFDFRKRVKRGLRRQTSRVANTKAIANKRKRTRKFLSIGVGSIIIIIVFVDGPIPRAAACTTSGECLLPSGRMVFFNGGKITR